MCESRRRQPLSSTVVRRRERALLRRAKRVGAGEDRRALRQRDQCVAMDVISWVGRSVQHISTCGRSHAVGSTVGNDEIIHVCVFLVAWRAKNFNH
eukprot:2978538-Pleurochrysis_carterae.AAC.2